MVGPMVGYGWIHTKSNQILLYVLVYKQILSYIFFGSKQKKVRKCMNGGGKAHPSLEYISGLYNSDWMWSCLDLVGYTQNSVHLPL